MGGGRKGGEGECEPQLNAMSGRCTVTNRGMPQRTPPPHLEGAGAAQLPEVNEEAEGGGGEDQPHRVLVVQVQQDDGLEEAGDAKRLQGHLVNH